MKKTIIYGYSAFEPLNIAELKLNKPVKLSRWEMLCTIAAFLHKEKDMEEFSIQIMQNDEIKGKSVKINLDKAIDRSCFFDDEESKSDIFVAFNTAQDLSIDGIEGSLIITSNDNEIITDISFIYNKEIISDNQAKSIADHFYAAYDSLKSDHEMAASKISIITEEERNLVLNKFNSDKAEYDKRLAHVLFDEIADELNDKIAITYEGQDYSYAFLKEKSSSIAAYLVSLGVKRGDNVALIALRGFEMIAAILGIMKAGAAVIPISFMYPAERIAFIIKDCSAKAVMTNIPQIKTAIPSALLINDGISFEGDYSDTDMPLDSNIVIIYTSGTTGTPKGVMLRHRTVSSYSQYNKTNFNIDTNDIIIQFAPFTFSTFVFEMFTTLLSGSRYLIPKDQVLANIAEFQEFLKGATIGLLPPPFCNMIELPDNLRICETGASFCSIETSNKISQKTRHLNAYGLSEGGIVTVWHGDRNDIEHSVPIGRPVANVNVYVLRDNELCGLYMPGELCVTGVGISNGYINAPELNAKKFVESPFGDGRMLRTGDIVQWTRSGNLEYITRQDDQIKVRGIRVELAEVEKHIEQSPLVKQAVAIEKKAGDGSLIAAYYISSNGEKVNNDELYKELVNYMPDYMLPSYMMQIEEFKLTVNGKIDKRALPEITDCIAADDDNDHVMTYEEKIASEVYKEVLEIDNVTLNCNFFQFGGHSLRASRAINILRNRYSYNIKINDIFAYPILKDLAKRLAECGKMIQDEIDVDTNRYMYPLYFAQLGIYSAYMTEPDSTVYNMSNIIEVDGCLDIGKLEYALRTIVNRHKILRTSFVSDNGIVMQKINDSCDIKLEVYDCGNGSEDEVNKCFKSFIRPFDLSKAPLIRMGYAAHGDRYFIMFDIHHIISDGMSMNIIINEISLIYNGKELPDNPIQFCDYTLWYDKNNWEDQRSFWKEEMKNFKSVLELPLDHPRKKKLEYNGESLVFESSSEMFENVNALCDKMQITEYMLLLSAYVMLLYRWSGKRNIILGTPVLERPHKEAEKMIGMFANTVPIMIELEENENYSALIENIKRKCLSVLANQNIPFYELVQYSGIKGDDSRNPLVDTMFAFQNNENVEIDFSGTKNRIIESNYMIDIFDILMNIEKHNDNYRFILHYNTDLFEKESIENIFEEFFHILDGIIKRQDMAVVEYFSETALESIENVFVPSVAEKITELSEKNGSNPAIISDTVISYNELDKQSSMLSSTIVSQMKKCKNNEVAIIYNGAAAQIIDILAVIKSGCSCIVIPELIDEMDLDYVWENHSGGAIIIPDEDKYSIFSESARSNGILIISSAEAVDSKFDTIKESDTQKDFDAHITVIDINGNVSAVLSPEDIARTADALSICFNNGKIVHSDKKNNTLTNINILLSSILCGCAITDDIHGADIVAGGVKECKKAVVNERIKDCVITDIFGNNTIGEANCFSALSDKRLGGIYYVEGKEVCSDTSAFRVVLENRMCSEKITGTLYIRSGKEYIKTDIMASIVNNRLKASTVSLMKHRMYDIDLQRYKRILFNECSVRDYAIVPYLDSLYLFIEADENEASRAKKLLKQQLPKYMLPKETIVLESMPTDTYGELNINSLINIISMDKIQMDPETETEKEIYLIIKDVLGIEELSVCDDFFELGCDSMKGIQIINRISEPFKCRLLLSEFFSNPNIKDLAGCVDKHEVMNEDTAIPHVEKKAEYIASSAQKRIYLLSMIDEGSLAYNMPGVLKFEHKLDHDRIIYALNEIVKRHEILRTTFRLCDGELKQYISEDYEVSLEFIERDAGFDINKEFSSFVRPFDFESDPLMRVRIIDTDESTYLMIDMDHIVCDGVSYELLKREFFMLYSGSELPEPTIQYKDYCEWFENLDLSSEQKYWKEVLSGTLPVLNFPLDNPRPVVQSFKGSSIKAKISQELFVKVKSFAKQHNVTEYTAYLSVLMILLSRYAMQEDIIVGTPVSGRIHRDTEQILGMFVNTLPIRAFPEKTKVYKTFLKELNKVCIESFSNQSYPFDRMLEDAEVNHDVSRNPLFDILFAFQNIDNQKIEIEGTSVSKIDTDFNISKTDISLYITPCEDHADVLLEYSSDIFKRNNMETFLKYYMTLLSNVCENDSLKLSDLEMLDKSDYETILNDYNNTKFDYKPITIQSIIDENFSKYADRKAVLYKDEFLTYAQLDEYSSVIGNMLRENGIGFNKKVVIISDRSLEMIVGIYGILRSGAAYVPVSPEYPEDRIKFIIEDCDASAVLYYHVDASFLSDMGICLVDLAGYKNIDGNRNLPENISSLDDCSYVIYTSGTTGKPKGVINVQSGTVNRIYWMDKLYPIGTGDTILQKTNYTFDVSVWEILWWSFKGAAVDMLPQGEEKSPEYICNEIYSKKVNVIHFVPSMFNVFLSYIDANPGEVYKLESLKYIFMSGEALSAVAVHKFHQLFKNGNIRLVNLYGPTEASIDVTWFECDKPYDKIPIGRPIDNINIFMLNDMKMCGIGVPGELCIAGTGLAAGYINRDSLTEEKFINNPFGSGKLYRTGDLARWEPDGNIEYLGRIDEQVKIRGMRIEIDEITAVIKAQDDIKDAAVIARNDKTGEKALYAYVVSDTDVNIDVLRTKLSEKLPLYMIPSGFMQIEELYVTKNGKLDKNKLPDIVVNSAHYTPCVTETEKKVADAFSEVLGIENVGKNHNFFEYGGHSLKAANLINVLYKKCGKKIKMQDIYQNPTVCLIAEIIDKCYIENGYQSIPKIETKEYYAASSAQKRLYAVAAMDKNSLAYNMPICIELKGELDVQRLKNAFSKAIIHHEAFRTSFVEKDGEVVQFISDDLEFVLGKLVSEKSSVEKCFSEFVKPFDLSKAPLIRASLCSISDEKNTNFLFIDIHHIICDGESISILSKDLSKYYNGDDVHTLEISYKDYAAWNNALDLNSQKEFWKRKMGEITCIPEIPLDYRREKTQLFTGDHISYFDDGKIYREIRRFSYERGTTEFAVLMSAYMIAIHKCFGLDEIILGNPTANRTHPDLAEIIGMFSNTVIFHEKINADMSLEAFIDRILKESLDIFENQEYPLDKIAEISDIKRETSRNYLFDMLFVLQNTEKSTIAFDGIDANVRRSKAMISKFDSLLNVSYDDEKYIFDFEFNTGLFKKSTIINLRNAFLNILELISAHPEYKISEVMSSEIYYGGSESKKSFIQLFEENAAKYMDKLLVSGENEITYAEMNNLTNKYALGIRSKFDEGSAIAFVSDSYVEYIAYMLAIIKSGNIAVPIIASDDEFEIEDMLEAAGCRGVIISTDNEYYDVLCDAADNLDITVFESFDDASLESISLPSNTKSSMLKFIDISTGKPCVYEYSSQAICDVIDRTNSMVTYEDIVLHYSAISDVISIAEIFISIGNGASLYYNDGSGDLKDVIAESKATLIILNKSDFFRINKTETGSLYGLKKIAVSDIIANNSLFDDIANNGTEVYVFGISKTACGITYTAKLNDNEFISDNIVLVRDEKMPENGSVGNCCIRHMDDLMYCDIIGRSCGNGNTAILHKEYSIKNMYQSDAGMLEIIAMEDEKIRDFALVYSNNQSYAFVSGDNSDIVSELYAKVPNYMLPDEIYYISSIPKDMFGNADKSYLIEYKNNEDNLQQNEMDEIQREVCGIVSELLQVENVMLKSDFFALGGNSLSAFKLINILEHRYGTRITLSYIFSNPDILSLCKCISEGADKNISEIKPAEIKEKYPVSPAQKRIYLEYAIAPSSTAYNVPFAIKLHKYPDIERMDNALAKLAENHEIIRTRFTMENDNIYQVIDDHVNIKIEICDKCYSAPDEAINDSFIRPFDLSNAPLLRMRLCKLNTDEALLLFDSHHIITDGTSAALLLKELETLYNCGEIEAQKLQYKDYSEWINGIDLTEQKKYWNNKFNNGVPALDIITDFARNNNMSLRGGHVKHPISIKLKKCIAELANKTNTTENVIYISALGILLSRYSRQESDIIVGSPVSGRNNIATEKMQGMFVNTVVLSLTPDRNATIEEYIAQIKNECSLCYDNQLYPYESLIDDLSVSKELSRNALFDVMFVYQNLTDGKSVFDGYEAEVIEINGSDTKFDLTFGIIENVDSPYIEIEYFKDLFKQDTIEIMLQHYEQIIISMSENINCKLDSVSEVNEDEFSKLLKLANNEQTYDKSVILSERFNRIAKEYCSKTAIVRSDTSITFEELDKASNRLARRLISAGVKPGERVMVLAEKNIASFISLLAIIKIRAVFVPVIGDFSEDRIKFIVDDAQAVLFMSEFGDSGYKLSIPEIAIISSDDKNSDSSCISMKPQMDDELYLIYTSGTTGNPKAIIINNLNISEFIFQMSDSLAPKAEESVLQFAKLVFDASVWEYIFTFAFGCTMYIPDADTIQRPELMGKFIKDAHISYALIPPIYIGYLDEKDLSSVKYVITGGQATNKYLVEKYGRNGYRNFYGPTETTVMVTQWEYNPGDIIPDRIPIGRPLANVCTYIVDNDRLCGFNIAGELLIGCDGISPGYVNNKELTEKQFIKNPFGKGKLYRSGDLCRMLPDGNIEYISRIDKQVKIRGFRIELAELENAINAIEGINSSVVIVRNRGIESIFAYYTSDENISEVYVLSELKKKLPNYMIPSAIMQIERIPVNSSGKTEEKLLPEIKYTSAAYEAPEGELEMEIAAAFEDVLCIEKVSVIDSFFEMGGDSIKAIRLINALANKGIKLSVKDIFANNNVRSIAGSLKRDTSNASVHSCGEATSDDEAIEMIVSDAFEKAKAYSEAMLAGGIIYEENLPSIAEISYESQIRFSYYEHIFNNVDIDVLKNAWNELCRASEALRSTIDIDNGMQYIYQYNERSEIPVINISEYNWESICRIKESVFEALNIYSRHDAYNGKELMCRPIILKINTNDYLFMLNVSHLIFDQQSQMTVAAYLEKCILGNITLPKQHSFREFIEMNKTSELNDQIRNELQIEMLSSSYHKLSESFAGKEVVPLQIVYRAEAEVNELLLMEAAEKVLYYAFDKLGCDRIPILAVSGSRNFSKASFDGVIGEFIDLIPVTALNSAGGLFQRINKSNTILKKNNIVFSSVLKSDESILGNTDFSNLMIPIFNYLGIHKDAVYNSNSIMFDNPMLYAVSSDGTNLYIGNIPVLNEYKETAKKEIEGILAEIFC